MKITVTEKNIKELHQYQGTEKRLAVGEELHVIKTKIPYPCINGTFAIVTDWQPSDNSKRMLERESHQDADKYGWKFGAKVLRETLAEKKESYAFNRWSIDMKHIKKIGI
jgi:hypothetical protein